MGVGGRGREGRISPRARLGKPGAERSRVRHRSHQRRGLLSGPGAANRWQVIWPDSPAIHDLAGNVWQRTASEYSRDYTLAHQPGLTVNPDNPRV